MIYVLSLMLVALMWGFGFVATKWTLTAYDPHWANAARFVPALILSIPFLLAAFKKGWHYVFPALLLGTLLYLGMLFQTIGLDHTSVAKSGFFTALYIFFVPLISILYFGTRYSNVFWLLLIIAISGIAMLCELKVYNFNYGDFLTVLCALCFALHIIVVGKITNRYNAFELNAVQTLSATILACGFSYFIEGPFVWKNLYDANNFSVTSPLMGFFFLGVFSSFISFAIQNQAQKHITSHVTGMILILEAVFAAFFGFILLNETLSLSQIVGCFLILSSVMGVSVFSKRIRKIKT